MRPTPRALCLYPALALLGGIVAAGAERPAPAPAEGERRPQVVRYPEQDAGIESLEARRRGQLEAAARLNVFHDFKLEDRLEQSGITFVHRIEEDAGKHYKAVHYDHGNGIAAADVDGDGRPDIAFFNQVGGNELWRNLGGGRFEDVTRKAGIALPDRIGVTGSFADTDNDGDPDLYVTTVRMGNVLFRNEGGGRFTDVTKESGLGHVGHSSGAAFFDYDADGLLDLFLANVGRYTSDERHPSGAYVGLADAFSGHLFPDRTEPSLLFRNLGGNRFADVTKQAGLTADGWNGDAGFGDVNEDGRPDLYVLNMQGGDEYFENDGGARFVERTSRHFPRTPWGTMGIKFFDYDNDGRFDLLLTDMHSDMSEKVGPEREKLKSRMQWTPQQLGGDGGAASIFGNALYHALGGGRFEEVSDAMGVENYWPWGVSVGDLNADGWEDVFIASSMNYPFRYGVNTLLLNDRGARFADAEFVLGVEPRRGGRTHTPWFELDCTTEGQGRPPCRNRLGRVAVWAPLGSRAAVMLDLDADGDLDIVTNDFNSEPMVLVSDLAERRKVRYLQVALSGTASNRDGLGALVQVHGGGRVYTRRHDGKSGYLSQSSLPLYFGLGDAARVDRVEVAWPSGRKQVVTEGLALGATVRITEPK